MPSSSSRPVPDFRLLFESAPGLYLVLTRSLTIIAVSDAYLRATMTTREEILGRDLFDVFPGNPDDPAASGVRNLSASLERVLQTRTSDTMAVQKYDIRKPDSEGGGFEERFWSPANSPVLGPDGEIAYIIHRVEDVTDFVRLKQLGSEKAQLAERLRTRAEQMEVEVYLRAQEVSEANRQLSKANIELAQLYDRAKELDTLKTQFFSNVSHELRTPLTLIIGPVEALLASGTTDEHVRRSLNVIKRNARLLLAHVNDLLDVSKIDAGKLALQYFDVDVAHLVRLTAGHFDSLARERQVDFDIDTPEVLRGQVDAHRLQRVVVNLLSNAFKFTPEGGRVRCTLRHSGTSATLEIADSGPGIPPEHQKRVFERFHQIEGGTTRSHGGTGLGLAIAREFVELHGGRIWVGDAVEGGALLTVQLPTVAPEGAEVTEFTILPAPAVEPREALPRPDRRAGEIQPPAAERGGHQALVLVVEDNRDMNQFVGDVLAAEYRIESAFNGVDGLRKAIELHPDLIVSDVMMPEMSGDVLVRELRSRPEFASTPILLLTAKADDDLRVALLQVGANDYVMKPFSTEELQARVRNLVSAKLADEQNRRLLADLQAEHHRLTQAMVESRRVNEELETFSYSVSHDLRAPLRSIDGFSQALLEGSSASLDEQGRHYLGRVRAGARRMAELIDDLLQLSRVGRADLQPEPVDVSNLAREVAAALEQADPGHRVRFVVEDEIVADADPRLLRIVLENLLGNAWKFTGPATQPVVELGRTLKGDQPTYFVRDNGVGFDTKYADRLFSPFQRLHSDSEFAGTGIGLATVQRIVRRHGGRVWAESAVGRGATFLWTLPSAKAGEN